jgi:2-oxoglutarate dehydrogenase E2 component (dihydrolipoamide succinyltransferase)
MPVEIVVPNLGESVNQVQLGAWLKAKGARVHKDEPLVEIESEKATVELPSPISGLLVAIHKAQGEEARVGEVIGLLEELLEQSETASLAAQHPRVIMPAAERLLHETKLEPGQVQPTGPGGRMLKEDVQRVAAHSSVETTAHKTAGSERGERAVRMSPMRRTIAARLLEAQSTAALLTTFNEVDMSAAISLRKRNAEDFVQRHGVKLGFMSLFVAAVLEGLRQIPEVNAEIRGEEVFYRDYCDIGIAVGGGRGLVVPVIRDAQDKSLADIEKIIADFASRAKDGKLTLDELKGGTFSITNGGVFGSLMSTPIVNPPQSAILGLHAIKDRPIALEGQVVIRPMMYVALTYDHRLIDGREAVTFLKGVKERIEQPERLLLGL